MSKEPKRRAFTLTLPEDMIGALDALADQVGDTRSGVIEAIIEYGLQEEHLDDLFPYEDDADPENQ